MSTKKYLILIVLGLILLVGLGGTFIYYYQKKNQATNVLTVIPTDVVAVVRVNHLDLFIKDDGKNPFASGVNPNIRELLLRLGRSPKVEEMLENPMLISFHPIGKNRVEPLVLLSSTEELSNNQMRELVLMARLKVSEISYNNRTIYTCTFANGYSLYLLHAKGITSVSPSLVLIESAARKLDAHDAVSSDLQNAYKLTSSTSDASIAVNVKAIASWVKANIFLSGLNMTDAASSLCCWMVIDYNQGADEVAFSGMLTVDNGNGYGKSLASVKHRNLLTPTLITENTAFCLERCYNDFRTDLLQMYPADKDSSKNGLKKLLLTINPERTIVQYVKSSRTDSAGFVAVLYPKDSKESFRRIMEMPHLGNISVNHIVRLTLDSTKATLSNALGASFQLVKPSYMLLADDQVVLAKSENILKMFKYENSIAKMRKNAVVDELWQKKITGNGVAALYFSPSATEQLLKSLFNVLAFDFFSSKIIGEWRGLGLTVTSSGSNLLLSGYMGRKASIKNTTFSYSTAKPISMHAILPQRDGGSLLAAANDDSLIALDGKMHRKWGVKLTARPDTLFTIRQNERSVLSLVADRTVTYLNDKGKVISRFTFPDRIEKVSENGINEESNNVYVIDRNRMLFLLKPFGKDQPKKLLKLVFFPDRIVAFTLKNQRYLVLSKNRKVEILNAKGAVVRKLSFDLSGGKVVVAAGKVLLFSPQRTIVLNGKFTPVSAKMSDVFKSCTDIYEGILGNRYTILLQGGSNIRLLTKNLTVERTVEAGGDIVHTQMLGSSLKGFVVLDDSRNCYLFDTKGRLSEGYPCNIGKATVVLNSDDGTLFAVSQDGNLIISSPIAANSTTLL